MFTEENDNVDRRSEVKNRIRLSSFKSNDSKGEYANLHKSLFTPYYR